MAFPWGFYGEAQKIKGTVVDRRNRDFCSLPLAELKASCPPDKISFLSLLMTSSASLVINKLSGIWRISYRERFDFLLFPALSNDSYCIHFEPTKPCL